MFSIAKTKLPHYVAPLIPALSLMAGCWWATLENKISALRSCSATQCVIPSAEEITKILPSPLWWKIGAGLMGALGIAALAALPVLHFAGVLSQAPLSLMIAVGVLAVSLGVLLLIGAIRWWQMMAPCGMRCWTLSMAIMAILLAAEILPTVEPLRPSKPVGKWITQHAPRNAKILAVTYKEPSLMFYSRRGLEEIGQNEADKVLARLNNSNQPVVVIISKDRWEKWTSEYQEKLSSSVGIRQTWRFFNFQNKGKWMELVAVGNWEKAEKRH